MMKLNIFNKKILAPALGLALLASASTTSAGEAQNVRPVADFNTCQKPEWPKEALRNEQTGTVVLSFLISAEGKVVDSMIVKSSGVPLLDEAAQRGIERCRQGQIWLRKASALGSPIAGQWLDNSDAANYTFGE